MLGRHTRTVTVTRPVVCGSDPTGVPVYGEPEREVVRGVLVDVADGAGLQMSGTGVDRGPRVTLVLHFPKDYDASLAGCTVELSEPRPAAWAGTWHVVGDPMPYEEGLTPGRWNREVHVTRAMR